MRELAVDAVDDDRLGVGELALASGRVADVPDGELPGQRRQRVRVERLVDVPHRLAVADLDAVGRGDARALLSAVLQRVQAEVGRGSRPRRWPKIPKTPHSSRNLSNMGPPSVYGL